MSVTFYSTVWAFAEKSKQARAITNQQLIDIAIAPGKSPDEGQAWLTKARRERAGKIVSRFPLKVKMYAGGSRGQCLYVSELSLLHPELLFVAIAGADCSEEESLSLWQNGKVILKYYGVIPYTEFNDHAFFKLLRGDGKNAYSEVESAGYDLISKLFGPDAEDEDAFREDDHEDFDA